jgi:hypothetical protein
LGVGHGVEPAFVEKLLTIAARWKHLAKSRTYEWESGTCCPYIEVGHFQRGLVGRPAVRWLDSVEEDLKTMGFRNWRRKSQDHDQWTEIVKEATADHRLYCPHNNNNNNNVGLMAFRNRNTPITIAVNKMTWNTQKNSVSASYQDSVYGAGNVVEQYK